MVGEVAAASPLLLLPLPVSPRLSKGEQMVFIIKGHRQADEA